MSKDALEISQAIFELKQNGNFLKDYLFPISMSLLSSFVGGCVALIINSKLESKKLEKEKFLNTNRLIFNVIEGLNNLIAIKSNYHEMKTDNPYLRAISFPETLLSSQRINIELSNYSFIRRVRTCNFTLKDSLLSFIKNRLLRIPLITPSTEELGKSWRNLSRIGAMLANYNTVLHHIEKRNKLDDVAREKLVAYIESNPTRKDDELKKTFMVCLGRKQSSQLIDLTELTISLIDHVILEMDSFTKSFADIAESNINLSKVDKNIKLIRIENDHPKYIACIKPILKPDFNELASLLGGNPEAVKNRYTFSS